MKRAALFIFILLSVFLITACNDNPSTAGTEDTVSMNVIKSDVSQKSNTGLENELIIKDIKTQNGGSGTISIMKDGDRLYFGSKENLKTVRDNIRAGVMMNPQGPFTVSASKGVIATGQYDFFDNIPGYAAQNFITDHWAYIGMVVIPLNTVGYAIEPSPVGWTDLYNRISGIYTTQSPSGGGFSVFTIRTYTIWVKSTILGHSVGIERPVALTDGFDYTYYYIEL